VAEYADAWNAFGPPATYAAKSAILDQWCAEVGRDPGDIERTVAINPAEVDAWPDYVEASADHIIVMAGAPFDLEPVARLVESVGVSRR
jgi:hypothetical protein